MMKKHYIILSLLLIVGCKNTEIITRNLLDYYIDPKINSIISIAEKDTTIPIYINYNESEIDLQSLKKLNGGSSYRMVGLSDFCDSIQKFKFENIDVVNLFDEISKALPKHMIYDLTVEMDERNNNPKGIYFDIKKLLKFEKFSICVIDGVINDMFSTDVIVFDKKGKIIRVFSDQYSI